MLKLLFGYITILVLMSLIQVTVQGCGRYMADVSIKNYNVKKFIIK